MNKTIDNMVSLKDLTEALESLSNLENVITITIGYSVNKVPINAYHIGDFGDKQVIIIGAIHAREWITALLIAELIKLYSKSDIKSGGIYFIPLCNPDGVKIALETEKLWKANGRGVDLNVNFDADWGYGVQNVREAGSENFIGTHPNSEPEVKALIDFTVKVKPRATIAYHSKGELIYYGFEPMNGTTTKKQLLQMYKLAKKIGKVTNYTLEKTKTSTGGYSDWVSMHLKIPALTIEVGNDDYCHPIGIDKLPEIFKQNKNVPRMLLSIL